MVNSETLAFGLGCFYFNIAKFPSKDFTVADYISAIRNILEKSTSIDNFVSTASDSTLESIIKEDEKCYSKHGDRIYLYSTGLVICFDVYIPLRIQKDLWIELFNSPLPRINNTERFKVKIHYSSGYPIAFVEFTSSMSPKFFPSDSVIIIRKFIDKLFKDAKQNLLRFKVLGPSPFSSGFVVHQEDFVFSESKNPNVVTIENWLEETEIRRTKRSYIDLYEFKITAAQENSVLRIKDLIYSNIMEEADLFYGIREYNDQMIGTWHAIEQYLQELLELTASSNFFLQIKSFPKTYLVIQNLAMRLTELESEQILAEPSFKRDYRRLVEKKPRLLLEWHLKNSLEDLPQFPVHQLRELINLLESRRINFSEGFVVIISAILGGVVGAVITLFLST